MKTIKRPVTSNFWHIGEHESYFSDMAAKGYHLKKVGRYFFTFEKGEPQEVNYRLELTPNKAILHDHIEMLEESGWKHVDSLDYIHVFRSPKNAGALEIHTDPQEQSYLLEVVNQKLRNQLIIVGILIAFMFAISLWMLFMNKTPILNMVQGDSESFLFYMGVYIYIVFVLTSGYLGMKKLRNQLRDGQPINHHAPYKKIFRRDGFITTFILLFVILSIINSITHIVKYEDEALLTDDVALPVVRLADLETKYPYDVVIYHFLSKDGYNTYTKDWSLLAQKQYFVSENFEISISDKPYGEGTYNPSINSKTFVLRSQILAKPLAKDLMKRYDYYQEPFVEVQHPEFDALFILNQDEMKFIVAVKSNVVTSMYVTTNSSEEELLEKMANAMNRK